MSEWTETHRETLDHIRVWLAGPGFVQHAWPEALDAALTEIDRLTTENEKLNGTLRRTVTTTRRIR